MNSVTLSTAGTVTVNTVHVYPPFDGAVTPAVFACSRTVFTSQTWVVGEPIPPWAEALFARAATVPSAPAQQ